MWTLPKAFMVLVRAKLTGRVRRDDGKCNFVGRSARSSPAPTRGQTALRRFRLANYPRPLQIWAAREATMRMPVETLLGIASHHEPVSYWDIAGHANPRNGE